MGTVPYIKKKGKEKVRGKKTYDAPDSFRRHDYHVWPPLAEPGPIEEHPGALVDDDEREVERGLDLVLLGASQACSESLVYRGRIRPQFPPAARKASNDGS